MPRVTLTDDRSFEAPAGSTLLDAARQAGLMLEHSCRSGRCGSCKARVLDGRAAPAGSDLSLSPEERAAGWILTCTSAASTDLRLQVQAVVMPPGYDVIKTLPCRIDALDRLAPDVLRIRLRLPPRAGFRALPGQSIDVIGRQGLRRSYSLANLVAEDGPLELHVRRVQGGAMSSYWFDEARPNDLLRFEGPRGTFFLRDVANLDLVLLATGTGIAPLKAMLESIPTLTPAKQPRSITLLWGGRRPEDLYWQPTSPELAFSHMPVLSRADASWQGARGHVQDVLLARGADWARTAVFACGSPAMIEDARGTLVAAGLPATRFHADAFVEST